MANPSSIWQKLNLSQAFGLFTAMMILLTGVTISTLSFHNQSSNSQRAIQQQSQQQLQRLAITLAPSLLNEDRVSLNLTLNEWQRGAEIQAIRILNTDQQVIAETGRFANSDNMTSQSITQDNLAIGMIQAAIDNSRSQQTLRRNLSLALLASALLACLGGLAAYQLSERMLAYVRRVPQQLKNWQHGDNFDIPAPEITEFKQLHETLVEISDREQQRRAVEKALGQFINTDHQEQNQRFCYQPCAMLYIEIQELEVLQNRLTANELSSLLNQYHRLLSQAAKLYNGKLDRFQGDGIVMLFGVPNPNAQDALHCLYAAELFLGLIEYMREHESKLLPLEFRIAAHFGSVLLAPIGEDQQLQGSLVGDTIHWASHLAQHGEERRLLVSQDIVDQIPADASIHWHNGPHIGDLHGKEVPSYWLNQLPEKTQSLIQRQIKHITAMTEQA